MHSVWLKTQSKYRFYIVWNGLFDACEAQCRTAPKSGDLWVSITDRVIDLGMGGFHSIYHALSIRTTAYVELLFC